MNKSGIYYGQCSELCGKGHGFMPIVVDSQHYSNQPFIGDFLYNNAKSPIVQTQLTTNKTLAMSPFNLVEMLALHLFDSADAADAADAVASLLN